MKFNKWTMGLAAVGVVSLASAARADETKMSQIQTALSSTTLSGYVDTAATWRPGTASSPFSGTANLPPYSFAKNDGFSLNAIDIALDKPEDESPWAAGYHLELMAGPDVPMSYLNSYVSGGHEYGPQPYDPGVALRQAYLALRTPIGNSGIDWKVGVFDTPIGYESTSDPSNPNYTRSYGYTIEPTTHTGILATYKINDIISVSAGIANTWSDAFDLNATPVYESQKTYMGLVSLTAPDSAGWMKGATFTGGVINAVDSRMYGNGTKTSWYAGMTLPTPISALKGGAAFDYIDLNHNGYSTWVAGLYGTYQINDKASANVRAEYVSDNGAGIGGIGYGGTVALEELTATLQYNLWANVLSRVEARWDHSEHYHPFGAETTTYAYTSGESTYTGYSSESDKSDSIMFALNLIYQF